jgi:uncharacterized protein (DUF302 family)
MYGITREVEDGFSETVEKTEEELSEQGFGVLTEINIRKKLEKKLDVEFQNYTILGACSPSHAYEALQQETELGLLLPCNVIVYEEEGTVYVSAVDPETLLNVTGNEDLEEVAGEIKEKLTKAVDEVADQ